MSKTKHRRTPRRDARDPYKEFPSWADREKEFEAKPFGVTLRWLLAGVALVLVVVVGLWGLGVIWSGPKGAGDVHKANNSALNRIQQQANFAQTRADFKGYLAKIKVASGALDRAIANKDVAAASQRQVELNGLRQQCVDTAQNYNADSQKITAKDWKSAGLPSTLDPARCAKG